MFLIVATAASALVWITERHRVGEWRSDVSALATSHANAIQRNVERALSSTYALAALVRQNRGSVPEFETIAAEMLPFYDGAAALALAPGGVVSAIVPLAGNEKAIGHNLIKDPQRDKEAIRARDTGALTLAGPFKLVQGGFAAAGRLPVFLGEADGQRSFWGFVSVLIRFPEVLESANLPALVALGFDYELWRVHPDSGERHVIAASGEARLAEPVEYRVAVPNGSWTLAVAPAGGWLKRPLLAGKVLLALVFSLLMATLADALRKLGRHQAELEARVRDRTAALVMSEQKLLDILDGVEAYIYIKDTDYRYRFANRMVCELFGAAVADIIGEEDDRFFDEETARMVRDTDRRVIEHGETVRTEEHCMIRGVRRVYWSVKLPLRWPDGSIYALCGISTDITERDCAEGLLRESEERFRSLFESLEKISVQGYDRHHRVIFWNRASEVLYGYTRDEAFGRPLEELIIPAPMREDVRAAIDRWIVRGEPIPAGELVLQRKDGRAAPVFSSHTMQLNRLGDPEMYCVDIDLTERYEAEARMREACVVFDSSSEGIMTTDPAGVITSVNPAFTAITGYRADEVIGRKSSVLRSGHHDEAFYQAMWGKLARVGHWEGEIWNRRRSGEIYPQWLCISAVRDGQQRVVKYVALFSDITERKQHEQAIWRQANFDALTGLANRSLLGDRLERALARAHRNGSKVGLIFLDLDGFKWINDTLGHDVGDELLIEVASRLKGCIREQDTAARLGGDEFTLVIHDLTETGNMLGIADKVIGVLREPFLLGGRQYQISGSAGVTIHPDDGDSVQTLLKNADIAMYKAKQGGKNRYEFYARQMQVDAQQRLLLETDLRAALARNEFVLHYQPVFSTATRSLVGAEALIRWQHPQRGMVSPLEFIPVAEDSGLIVPIGEWVLREAARQWCVWRAREIAPLRLSVNVSGVQFREDSFGRVVGEVLQQNGIEPGSLMLEITESVLMDGSPEAEARMREIKALGVGYSLDDFGTGFSSLSYLKRFPVDIVKIDRSFVADCPDDRNDAHLVEAIVHMAHSLGMQVTAEGVETETQLEFLRDLACEHVQGYLTGRPLPPAEFQALLARAAQSANLPENA